jgi:transposase InsO family protein
MDLVGPARVRSVGGKWYVLVVVDDYSRYAWVFFLEDKSETFVFVRDLIVRLKNERHGNAIRAIHSDNGSEFKNSRFDAFCRDLGLEHQYLTPFVTLKMESLKGKIGLFVRWLG